MPPATRVKVFMQRVAVALRPAWTAALALALSLSAPPVARADLIGVAPPAPLTNEQVTLSSGVNGATSQTWDLDGDGRYDDASGPVAHWSFPTSGSYTVRLFGTNSAGETFVVTRPVLVLNRAPVAAFTVAPLHPLAGDSIVLTSISADSDGPLVTQAWDLDGDGGFQDAQGPIATVAFEEPGTHAVGLLVSDRDGATHAAAAHVEVRPRPLEALSPFPVVRIVGSFGRTGIRIDRLLVTTPAGAKVEIRCRGHGCPFRRLVRKGPPLTVRVRRFARRLLRPGAVVQVWVTSAGEIGKYTRFRIRRGKPPVRVDRCLPPGSRRPAPCPA
jgi:PKD repeat protein